MMQKSTTYFHYNFLCKKVLLSLRFCVLKSATFITICKKIILFDTSLESGSVSMVTSE
jgi:hypothetical protein